MMKTAAMMVCLTGGVMVSVCLGQTPGTMDAGLFGPARALQTVGTGFGNNGSELNGLYAARTPDGFLHVGLAGNIEGNGNTMVIFVDSRPGGCVASTLAGGYGMVGSIGGQKTDDWGTDVDGDFGVWGTPGGGSVLSPGFNPDYAIEVSGEFGGCYVNVIDLSLPNEPNDNRDVYLGFVSLMEWGGVELEFSYGPNSGLVRAAFDNSNFAGVNGFGEEPGDPSTCLTGLTLALSREFYAQQGPGQGVKVMAFITNGSGEYLSNQFLPGLPADAGNVGLANEAGEGDPLFDARNYAGSGFVSLAVSNPCPADLGVQGGQYGHDGLLDNNDFVVFINLFFASDPRADLASQGGILGGDGLRDNNDFVVFIGEFFQGCAP